MSISEIKFFFCRIFNAWVLIKIMTFYSKEIAISADKLPEICIIKKNIRKNTTVLKTFNIY